MNPRFAQSLAQTLRSEPVLAGAILFAVLNALFFPALWGDRTLMTSAGGEAPSLYLAGARPNPQTGMVTRTPDPGAPAWQLEPTMAFNGAEMFRHFRLPRWNPFVAYGTPWAAGMLAQPAFVLALLPEALPGPRAISWFVVLRIFVAGLFTFLFMRFFIPFAGSVVAAIACMLTGYFVLYLNIDHLSTEVLLPAVFWSFERMYRIPSSRGVLPASLMIWLTIVSGMPESTLLVLAFGYAYYLVRVLSDRRLRFMSRLGRLVAANLIGFGMAAFLLLPFYEFLQHGLDAHRTSGRPPGLGSVSDPRGLLLYLIPLVFGPFGSPTMSIFASRSGLFGYFGIGPVLLALVAGLSLFRRNGFWTSTERRVALFFLCAVPLILMKHWGSPIVNWIGRVPLFHLVWFPKYIQPLGGFSLACLAGFGTAKLISGKLIAESWASIGAIFAIMALLFASYRVMSHKQPGADVHLIYTILIAGFCVLFAWTALLANAHWPALRRYVPIAVIVLVLSELSANYIAPVYYIAGGLPFIDRNPYAGAPFVSFLESKRSDLYRVFGRGVMFPNWSSVYRLFDVRYLSAVTYNRYLTFAKSFLETNSPDHDELHNRFMGFVQPYFMLSATEQRFLQLSSVRYLATATPFVDRESTLTGETLKQNAARLAREPLSRAVFVLDGRPRDVLFQHPPSRRLSLNTVVPADAPSLRVSPAIAPKVTPGCGDGVEFQIEVDDRAKGGPRLVYDRYIDPKAAPAAQHWLNDFVDLQAYRGKEIHLLFSTNGGPVGDLACDWAGWGDLRFVPKPVSGDIEPLRLPFRLVFHDAADVYEYPYSLPRASVFSNAVAVNSPEEALVRLKAPEFDPWHQVVVEASPPEISLISQQAPEVARPARIESMDAERVSIHAELDRPGLLLLTDSNYPGWEASVDGKPAKILKTNYLFRGVMLPPGSHRVEFRYAPVSYAAGYASSLCSALAAAVWMLRGRRNKTVPSKRAGLESQPEYVK